MDLPDLSTTNESVPKPSLEQRVDVPDKKKKKKKDKSVWDGMFNHRKLKKPKSVAVLFLRNNGKAESSEQITKNGFFSISGNTYHEDKDCIWRMGKDGISLAIIEENSLMPLGTRNWYEKRKDEGQIDYWQRKFAELQDHVMKGIRHAELVKYGGQEKKMTAKNWILLGLALVVGLIIAQNFI